ncbi:MAG: ABC transporter permease [Ktedonobacterales bacterium]
MGTVIALYIASIKEFIRDRAAMFWTLAFPILFIVLFGVIFSGNNSVNYTVGLVNEDTGPIGQQLAQTFHSVTPFTIKAGSYTDELNGLKQGQRDLVIVIPAGLSQQVNEGQPASIHMFYDPSTNQADAQIKVGITQQVLAAFNQKMKPYTPPLTLEQTTTTSHQLRSVDYLMPGILAMALMQLGLFATATPLVSLRQEQVLRRLGATPLPRWQLLTSQVMLRLTIGIAQCALIIGLSVSAFHVQIQGNYAALAGLIILGALMFVALGYLIASVAKTVESASGIASAVNFPMMFLSGIFFPLAVLPAFLTPIVRALPLTYLADAFRQVTIGSVPEFPIAVDIAVLAGWIVVCGLLSARLFKWE